MSYSTIAANYYDVSFNNRMLAAIAQEQKAKGDVINPNVLLGDLTWSTVTASDVEAAYASALAGGNPDPGGDPAVVTDGMILANVQANWPEGTP